MTFLSILIALLIIAVVCLIIVIRKQNKKVVDTIHDEFIANSMNPYGIPLEDDEEYWQMLRHDTASEILQSYFASNDSGLPNEDELTDTILRYVDKLILKLRAQ